MVSNGNFDKLIGVIYDLGDAGYLPQEDETSTGKSRCESALSAGILEIRPGVAGKYFLSPATREYYAPLFSDPIFDVETLPIRD